MFIHVLKEKPAQQHGKKGSHLIPRPRSTVINLKWPGTSVCQCLDVTWSIVCQRETSFVFQMLTALKLSSQYLLKSTVGQMISAKT